MEQKASAKIAHAKRSSRYIASVQQHQPKQQARPASPDQSRLSPSTIKLLKRLGLKHITTAELTIRRGRHGRGFGPRSSLALRAELMSLANLAPLFDHSPQIKLL
jgi:hypothetical protein